MLGAHSSIPRLISGKARGKFPPWIAPLSYQLSQLAMAKERSADKEERKKEKKASKEKRSEVDGVHKSKKDKKADKEKKAAAVENGEITTKLLNTLENEKPGSIAVREEGDIQVNVKSAPILGALVPFANPLADEKAGKKVLKSVKKGTIAGRPCLWMLIQWTQLPNTKL